MQDFKYGYLAPIGYRNVVKSTLLNRLVGVKPAIIPQAKDPDQPLCLLGLVNLPLQLAANGAAL